MKGGFRTKELATSAMNKLQQEKAEGSYVERSKWTVGGYLQRWIKDLERSGEVRDATVIGWDVVVRRHLVPHIGTIRLQDLTREHVKRLYSHLGEEGRADGERGLSPKSVWNAHLCLHRALRDAVEDRLLRSNPAHSAMRKPRDKPEIEFWTSEELETFLAWAGRELACGARDGALYRMASQTGMRRGELLGLRWREVDLENGLVTVIQQLTRQRRVRVGFGAPKTLAGRRTINLSAGTVEALRVVKEAQAFARHALGEAYKVEDDLVFCRDDGTRHDPDVVSKRFARHVKRSEVRRLHFHGLRHTAAVVGLRELGEWPDECSRRLGHSSVAFTLETYGHLVPKRGESIAAAFDRLLAERRGKRGRREQSVSN